MTKIAPQALHLQDGDMIVDNLILVLMRSLGRRAAVSPFEYIWWWVDHPPYVVDLTSHPFWLQKMMYKDIYWPFHYCCTVDDYSLEHGACNRVLYVRLACDFCVLGMCISYSQGVIRYTHNIVTVCSTIVDHEVIQYLISGAETWYNHFSWWK